MLGSCSQHQALVSKSTGKEGRADLAVALLYRNRPKTVYMIEVKFEKMEEAVVIESINEAHDRNLKKAKEQLGGYEWLEPKADNVQKIAVSGVWYRLVSGRQVYELSTAYEFLS